MKRAALILAGGKSSRMGIDKAALPFGPQTLLQHIAGACRAVCDTVIVATGPAQTPRIPLPVGTAGLVDPGEGPLGAIAGGLASIDDQTHLFVTACDTPLLRPAVIDLLFERSRGNRGAVAVVRGRPEPLCAVYAGLLREEVARLVELGERKAIAPAALPGIVEVWEDELRAVDPDLRSFRGCNTTGEYVDLLNFAGLPIPSGLLGRSRAAGESA